MANRQEQATRPTASQRRIGPGNRAANWLSTAERNPADQFPAHGPSANSSAILAFTSGMLFCCLFLQRFGTTSGAQVLNAVGPIGIGLAGLALFRGSLCLHIARLRLYVLMVILLVIGTLVNAAGVTPFNAAISVSSLMQFLAISAMPILSFAEPIDERVFFLRVNGFLVTIALFGIAQFFIQFAGVQIFAFSDFLPSFILAETNWHLQIFLGIGDLMKSNGFFLVEPSVMSQLMAIALIIEVLFFRRPLYLLAFVLGFVLAFSGTGGLILAGFIVAVAVRLGPRGLVVALLMIILIGLAAGIVMLLAPDIADSVQSRMVEFRTPGSSGHMRFITPFWLVDDVLRTYPLTALFGMGAGTSEHLVMPYEYDVNTPIKIGIEYGFPALITYVSLFLVGERTPRQSVLVLPCVVLLMFTGGYQQFAPLVFLVALLICLPRLKVAPATMSADG